MIVPLAHETEWAALLEHTQAWQPSTPQNVWIVAPHPDDETLAAGGLIARFTHAGATVRVLAVTDGEHAYRDNTGLATLRIQEQEAALARLGVPRAHIHRLHLTDSSVATSEATLQSALTECIEPGSLVLAPWPNDFHPDHEACGRAVAAACRTRHATCVFYLFWTWHRGTPQLFEHKPLLRLSLTRQEQQAKAEALAEHRSQLHPWAGEAPILPENLLWPARMPCEVYLP